LQKLQDPQENFFLGFFGFQFSSFQSFRFPIFQKEGKEGAKRN
jgi:hypothetical protein